MLYVSIQVYMCLISELSESKAHHLNHTAQIRNSQNTVIESSPRGPLVLGSRKNYGGKDF